MIVLRHPYMSYGTFLQDQYVACTVHHITLSVAQKITTLHVAWRKVYDAHETKESNIQLHKKEMIMTKYV